MLRLSYRRRTLVLKHKTFPDRIRTLGLLLLKHMNPIFNIKNWYTVAKFSWLLIFNILHKSLMIFLVRDNFFFLALE